MKRSLPVLLAALFSLATVGATGCQPASPAPTRNGLIAFNRAQDIYVATAAGTGLRRLTSDGRSSFPKWSRDGSLLAFQRDGAVWTMRADGSGQRRITTGRNPAWSPDGKTLAFVRTGTCGGRLWTVPATGGVAAPVIGSPDCTYDVDVAGPVSWTSDGTRIAYAYSFGDQYGTAYYQTATVAVAGGDRSVYMTLYCDTLGDRTVCPGSSFRSPATHPVASRTAPTLFVATDDNFSRGPTTGVPVLVEVGAQGSHRQVSDAGYVAYPAPSPDGTRLLFTSHAPGQPWRLFTVATTADASTAPTAVLTDASQGDWQPVT